MDQRFFGHKRFLSRMGSLGGSAEAANVDAVSEASVGRSVGTRSVAGSTAGSAVGADPQEEDEAPVSSDSSDSDEEM